MKLKNNGIHNLETWKKLAPPMGGDKQWKEGRSAMELARYMTADYPAVPSEIEDLLVGFTDSDSEFDWSAEYVTSFAKHGLGRGEGLMYNSDIVIGIEGKADESFGSQTIGEALKNASDNKLTRINGMLGMLFDNPPKELEKIRYQLVTATAATLIEAMERNAKKALVLVIVFKKDGCFSEEKIVDNNKDLEFFLSEISATPCGSCYAIPTPYGREHGIDLYFAKIEIDL
ncbi:MAG: hypothetical protein IKU43_09950 [Clostridia bacterium]|nr:hypothetical protein [Clostridia bacterium]